MSWQERIEQFILKAVLIIALLVATLLFSGLMMQAEAQKKGVAGPGGGYSYGPEVSGMMCELGVDWCYSWSYRAGPLDLPGYIPMIRSIHPWDEAAIALYPAGATFLVGNEPDGGQDNLTPTQAAEIYGDIVYYLKEHGYEVIFGGGCDPSQWKREDYWQDVRDAWQSRWGEPLNDAIDGWHVHAYAHPFSSETQQNAIDRVQRQLLAWKAENPGLELWVTEYGNLQRGDADTMIQMTLWLDVNVDRYAFFYAGDSSTDWDYTSLFGDPWPSITDLGMQFAALGGVVPTATAIPTTTPTSPPVPTEQPTATSWPTMTAQPPTATPEPDIPMITVTPAATETGRDEQIVSLLAMIYNLLVQLLTR